MTTPTKTVERLQRTELVRQLSESLGREKANEVVLEAATALGLGALDYDKQETLRILTKLSAAPGLVGIVARFAKVRVILLFK